MSLIQIDKRKRNEARENIGRFSSPSKMPCFSFSIRAEKCITGSKLAEIPGSVCSGCYALKGSYVWENTKNAMIRRESKLVDRKKFIADFVTAIQGETLFRWFDSGDLQSLNMLKDIVTIAKLTPTVRYWLPTKEVSFVAKYLKKYGSFPSNLTVRVSGYMIDSEKASTVSGNNSLVFTADKFHKKDNENYAYCVAPSQKNECRDCRACWDRNVTTIVYLEH